MPPRGKPYQWWFADGGRVRSAALLSPARTSQAMLMQGQVDGISGIGITVEPAGIAAADQHARRSAGHCLLRTSRWCGRGGSRTPVPLLVRRPAPPRTGSSTTSGSSGSSWTGSRG
ncbi:anti-sigma factor domain-containing protein [Streptomyces sp. NPDC048419]|uniref:anti-sigma factor domain-containing protein n=1 Tax=Streptomyces sp. NPDC048419 TaxID=3365547 RepID=UPI00371BBAD5